MKISKFAFLASLALAACTQADEADPDMADGPVKIVEVMERLHFEDLDAMVESSDAVIIGQVVEVGPGEIRGVEEDGTGGIQFAEATLRVEAVLAGSLSTDTLVIESLGWADYGRAYEFADGSTHHIHTQGERAVFYLVQTRRADDRVVYRLVNSQGKYVIDDDGTVTATRMNDGLASRIATLGLAELRAEMRTLAP